MSSKILNWKISKESKSPKSIQIEYKTKVENW